MVNQEAESLLERAIARSRDSIQCLDMIPIIPHPNYEEAADLYILAANKFKASEDHDQAVLAFEGAAECHLKLGNKYEAANHFISAAKLESSQVARQISDYSRAVTLLVDLGHFSQAARYTQVIAEIHEQANDPTKAIESYQQAAEWFAMENAPSLAKACMIKIADLSALQQNYPMAIATYNELLVNAKKFTYAVYLSRSYVFKIIICHLCLEDVVAAQLALANFVDANPEFIQDTEHRLMSDLINGYQARDIKQFMGTVVDFDRLDRIDPINEKLLLVLKRKITTEPSLF